MVLSRRAARQIGDLREQIQVAICGLPLIETAPTVRVRRYASSVELAACELWVHIGQRPEPRRLCDLSAGHGLRMQFVERAIWNAGLTFATTGQQGRGRWRHFTTQHAGEEQRWFELALLVPGLEFTAQTASDEIPGIGDELPRRSS